MRICCIYRIRNTVNNKSYIGKSTNFKFRKYCHINCLKKNKHSNIYLQRSYNKHGVSNFKFEIILKFNNEINDEILGYYEKIMIVQYGTIYNKNGYNISESGEGHRQPTKVYQYDKYGNYITNHNSIPSASYYIGKQQTSVGYISKSIDKYIKNTHKIALGFIWKSEYQGDKIELNKKDKKLTHKIKEEFMTQKLQMKGVKGLLINNPGYFKKGKAWIINKFGYSEKEVIDAFKELKQENKEYRNNQKDITKPVSRSKFNYFREKVNLNDIQPAKEKIEECSKNKERDRVLVIGDLHEPFCLDGYLDHCKKAYKDFNCNKVVFIGDLVDNHAISYHEHDPNGKSPYDEYELAIKKLHKWYEEFPEAVVTIGNHDALGMRKVYTAGLPSFWLKSLEQILEAPKSYKFDFHFVIDDVFYTHGTGVSGDGGAMKIATQNRQSAVIGHLHSISNIKYSASYKDLIFAMTVGCGIDRKQYAFAYGKDVVSKPIISCGVVLEGNVPILIPMNL